LTPISAANPPLDPKVNSAAGCLQLDGDSFRENPMIDHIQEVQVSIDSPFGSVFRGFSKAVVIKAKKQAIIEFRRNWVNYVSLSENAEMTVEIGTGCRRFLLKNAMARLDKDKLSILAERISSPHNPRPKAH
jgi:hypothetical protein